ncbi:MAG: hypothetical protein D9V47_04035 [Clostridia bacterium]|nr:MAG: hypothetical protein D9V47_04035 [Clostridia bacterium]
MTGNLESFLSLLEKPYAVHELIALLSLFSVINVLSIVQENQPGKKQVPDTLTRAINQVLQAEDEGGLNLNDLAGMLGKNASVLSLLNALNKKPEGQEKAFEGKKESRRPAVGE